MTILQIEQPIQTYDVWKAAFDGDPVGRRAGGVRRYRIYRAVDDPNYVALDLEFDDQASAESFRSAFEHLCSPQAAGAPGATPHMRIVNVVEERTD